MNSDDRGCARMSAGDRRGGFPAMIRRLAVGWALVWIAGSGFLAAQQGTVQGTVQGMDGIPLFGAVVSVKSANLSVQTDAKGAFTLRGVPSGIAQIEASLPGFAAKIHTVYVVAGESIEVKFSLEIEKISVETEVVATRPLLSTSPSDNRITLAPSQIETLPSLGERDIFRAFQLLPGIIGSNEASSGLYVRGGKPDQNLILFDGFTLYHVEHLYGYFSPFNPNAVHDVRLSKGGFEAKYGGRLSSVMELEGETADRGGFHGGVGASFLSLDGTLEVPLGRRASLLLAARRSFQTPLYDTILDMVGTQESSGPAGQSRFKGMGDQGLAQFESDPLSYFYDFNGKLAWSASSRDLLTLSFYNGQDKLDNSRDMEAPSFFTDQSIDFSMSITDVTKWGNWGMSAVWTREWSDSFRSRVVVSSSKYYDVRDRSSDSSLTMPEPPDNTDGLGGEAPPDVSTRQGSADQSESNNLWDVGAKWENIWKIASGHSLEFGLEAVQNRIAFSLQMDDASVFGFRREEGEAANIIGLLDQDATGLQISGFVQDRWLLFDRLTVTPGLRLTRFDRTATTYAEPRFDARLQLSRRLTMKAAWGIYHQFANRIVREDVMQGDRAFWSLADGVRVPVGRAIHWIAGLAYETDGWLIDAEAYVKELSGVAEYSTRFAPPDESTDFGSLFYQGTGRARGIEFLLQKKAGRYTGWISYTLSRVEYDVPGFGSGSYPASHDVPFELKWVNSYELKKWTFSATWIYATGRPYTPATGIDASEGFNGRTFYRVVTGEKNSARLPDYHRLDLAVSFRFQIDAVESHVGVSVFNVYNRTNVWYKEFQSLEGELIETNVTLMGLTFNLFATFRF
jgi:ferric enterobactin receptor